MSSGHPSSVRAGNLLRSGFALAPLRLLLGSGSQIRSENLPLRSREPDPEPEISKCQHWFLLKKTFYQK
uniref:Uncharacterized protein n=1 Tax=Ditylenchus dipsaci TaxID=166011 RepID=A0A915CTU5_9BILA